MSCSVVSLELFQILFLQKFKEQKVMNHILLKIKNK